MVFGEADSKTMEIIDQAGHTLSSNVATKGDEGAPTLWRNLVNELRRETVVLRQIFDTFTMGADVNEEVTQDTGAYGFRVGTQGANFTENGQTYSNTTYTAVKIANYLKYTQEITEDTVSAFLQNVTQDVVKGISISEEAAMINGDPAWSGATQANLTSWTPTYYNFYNSGGSAKEDPRYLFNGLRKLATATAVAYGGGFDISKFRKQIDNIIENGGMPEYAFVTPRLGSAIKALDVIQRVDARGDVPGTINSQPLGSIDEVNTLRHRLVYRTLLTGEPNVAGTQNEIIMFSKEACKIGDHRVPIVMKTDEQVRGDYTEVGTSTRMAFASPYPNQICIGTGVTTP